MSFPKLLHNDPHTQECPACKAILAGLREAERALCSCSVREQLSAKQRHYDVCRAKDVNNLRWRLLWGWKENKAQEPLGETEREELEVLRRWRAQAEAQEVEHAPTVAALWEEMKDLPTNRKRSYIVAEALAYINWFREEHEKMVSTRDHSIHRYQQLELALKKEHESNDAQLRQALANMLDVDVGSPLPSWQGLFARLQKVIQPSQDYRVWLAQSCFGREQALTIKAKSAEDAAYRFVCRLADAFDGELRKVEVHVEESGKPTSVRTIALKRMTREGFTVVTSDEDDDDQPLF